MRLIDADVLDEKLQALAERYEKQGRIEVANDYNFVATVMGTAPTIDPESLRPQGEWHLFKDEGFLIAECSNCGMIIGATQAAWWDYCPNCGARLYISEDIKR